MGPDATERRFTLKRRHVLAAVPSLLALTALPATSKAAQWRRDGAGRLARFGILTPSFDPVPESEMAAIAPPNVSLHTARVPGETRPFADPPNVDEAVARLDGVGLNTILYAFTTTSY